MDIPNSVNKFTEFAKKCASINYPENSKEWSLAWKSIKFGMGCNITKEYWQQGMYSEEEIIDLVSEFSCRLNTSVRFQEWFNENKKIK